MSCRRHDDFNGHTPRWGSDPTVCDACGYHYKWWIIAPCDAQLERRAIAEERAKAGRPWWAGPALLLFLLVGAGAAVFVFFAIRGLLR